MQFFNYDYALYVSLQAFGELRGESQTLLLFILDGRVHGSE